MSCVKNIFHLISVDFLYRMIIFYKKTDFMLLRPEAIGTIRFEVMMRKLLLMLSF